MLSGLRRGELFALRWKDLHTDGKRLTVREAVNDGKFGRPKTAAGQRTIPLSETALMLIEEWKRRVKKPAERLVFSTRRHAHLAEQRAAAVTIENPGALTH